MIVVQELGDLTQCTLFLNVSVTICGFDGDFGFGFESLPAPGEARMSLMVSSNKQKNYLTVVGPSPRLRWVRRVLKLCITKKLSPRDVISAFICNFDQRVAFVRDLDVPNVEKTAHLVNKDGATEVTVPFLERLSKFYLCLFLLVAQ